MISTILATSLHTSLASSLVGYLGLDFYASWGYILLLLSSMDYGKYLDTTCYNLLDKTCLNLDCLYGEMEQKS
jgi:hypothetical protein